MWLLTTVNSRSPGEQEGVGEGVARTTGPRFFSLQAPMNSRQTLRSTKRRTNLWREYITGTSVQAQRP
jgi:hypothetical protein